MQGSYRDNGKENGSFYNLGLCGYSLFPGRSNKNPSLPAQVGDVSVRPSDGRCLGLGGSRSTIYQNVL